MLRLQRSWWSTAPISFCTRENTVNKVAGLIAGDHCAAGGFATAEISAFTRNRMTDERDRLDPVARLSCRVPDVLRF